jgi:hypothetical protein
MCGNNVPRHTCDEHSVLVIKPGVIDTEGTLWFKDRLVVPKIETLKRKILDEAHTSRYSIHPGSTKMYHDLRQQFWWT